MDTPIITHHAAQRAKERMGLNRKAILRQAKKALMWGIKLSDVKGNFERYLYRRNTRYETGTKVRVYGEYVYIFSSDLILITPQSASPPGGSF